MKTPRRVRTDEALLDHVAKDQMHSLINFTLPVSDADGDESGFSIPVSLRQ